MKNIYIFIFSIFFISNVQAQAFSLDTSFNVNYSLNYFGIGGRIHGLNYEPDGKLMIYGFFNDGNTADIIRVYDDGNIDNTWHYIWAQGVSFIERYNNEYIVRTSDLLGKFSYYGQIADTAWSNNVWRGNICHSFYQPYIFSDGSMLVGTDSICNIESNKKRWFIKYFADGNVDTSFKHSPNRAAFGVVKYSYDKLLVYGGGQYGFTRYDSTQINRMCRIDTLGNLDTTFKSIFIGGSPYPAYIQNDGKIIVSKQFDILNSVTNTTLIRLNADGSLDSTFNNFNSVNWTPTTPYAAITVCPTTDGGYLIGGEFRQYQGYQRNNIVKTDANGYIDTAYFNGQAIDSTFQAGNTPYVFSIVKGTNDTYYVMGYFTYYNGKKVNPIIRIHGLSVGINEVEKEKGEVKVFPNPAKDYITFSWELPLLKGNAQLIITDINGKSITQKTIATKQGQWIWDTRSINKGIYLYEIKTDNERLGNGKVIINK